jgi:predicted transcriptional regulator
MKLTERRDLACCRDNETIEKTVIDVLEEHGKFTTGSELYESYKQRFKKHLLDKTSIGDRLRELCKRGVVNKFKIPGMKKRYKYGLYTWFYNNQPKQEFM